MPRHVAVSVAIFVAVVLTTAAADKVQGQAQGQGQAVAQTPLAKTAPQVRGTGMIVGQVVDGTTGEPVPEAIVRLTMPNVIETITAKPAGLVMADADGRFFFADLSAAEYYLNAKKDGYIDGGFGQRRVGSSTERLGLREGERRTDVKLFVWKYAVIGGTVVNDLGEPVVGIAVRALVKNVVAGRTQFGATSSYLVPAATTDDRGVFRLPRLQPGTYAIVAPATHASVPVSVMQTWDTHALRTELFWAGVYEISPLGSPQTQQVGDTALITLNTVLIPPPPAVSGGATVYRTTFFPSATTVTQAEPITVGAGEERMDLAITLRPSPAVRVSGRLVTSEGTAPPPMAIRLSGESSSSIVMRSGPSSTAEVGFETATAMSDSAGRFTILAVPPGQYEMTQGDRFLGRTVDGGGTRYWISQPITVGATDIRDLVVNVQRVLRVEGRLEFRSTNIPPPPPPRVVGIGFERPFGEPGQFFAELRNNAFATAAAAGRYIAQPLEPAGWFVRSVTLDGQDITDRAFDLTTDATSFVVTYSDRPSKVSGTVKDSNGNLSRDALVLVFPVDPQRWTGYGNSPRFLRSAGIMTTGLYTFAHLPPGEYYVIAIDSANAEGWLDPKRLQSLAGQAERLTVTASDGPRTLDLPTRSGR
jgi:hypothetical protein